MNQTLHKFGVVSAASGPAASVVGRTLTEDTVLDTTYSLPIRCLSKSELEIHCRTLTMTPEDTGYGPHATPPCSFPAYLIKAGRLHVPRFYGLRHWGPPQQDRRSGGDPVDMSFQGVLGEVQREAVQAVLAALQSTRAAGMLVLPCGYGKTVCALYVAAQLGVKTLVVVNKGFLVTQWQERIRTFLPGVRVGTMQQKVADFDADVVVGMVHSLAKREYPTDALARFGLVIVDEAHHMSAPFFSGALRKLAARHILALSATPERRDGLTPLLHWSMGKVCFRAARQREHTLVSCMLYGGGARKEITYQDGRISLPLMLNALVRDNDRNVCIVEHVQRYMEAGRHVLVLSDRVLQLDRLHTLLCARNVSPGDMAHYIGSTNPRDREGASAKQVILSTYCMAKEGLDIPRLDTLVMATPKGDVVQAVGRIQRTHPGKKTPLIVDIVDTFSLFQNLHRKRAVLYQKERFLPQTLDINDRGAWFV